MNATIAAFLVSLISCLLIIRYQHLHSHVTGDSDLSGPQKFHHTIVPRIGGIAILFGLLAASLVRWFQDIPTDINLWVILACSLPAAMMGLTEDLTKKISVRTRLLATTCSALLASHFLNAWINRIDIIGFDYLLTIPAVSIIFTCIAIAGLANAYNIIDGFNGLASMVAIIALLAITYVAIRVDDNAIAIAALVMAGSLAGFFLWNYPRGLIFLGDGGAYLIGFWIATLSILLVSRHPEISPWFALMVNCYPIFETLFSIWRKKIYQGKSPGQADAAHFHSLIYRRIIRWAQITGIEHKDHEANARTSSYLWFLSSLAVLPAVLWWQHTWLLQLSGILFAVSYIYLYIMIVKFKTPSWIR
jgi:UDP-N-acetylmuramyl pentapeptide phosphotransferase/UDP-N-acetylglucosamine-1-phosphate transferase